ncbi:asparagine synthetase B [Bacteroidota bacterium]|nr:asparagine synthetase B [Bacteroidota bacterium]
MCGIAGVFTFQAPQETWFEALVRASDSLIKRGPDAGNIWRDENVGLAHRRLSIIDTSEKANQPMLDKTKRYAIVFNGEIFNFAELKSELIKKGISFFTNSDTEVILQLYITEKENFLNKLNGFFAFAIYDSLEKKMMLARDRYGEKPLYYYKDEKVFSFASELKAISCFPIKKEIDPVSLNFYFQLNYIPQPNTIFKNVRQLMPGHFIVLDKNSFEEKIFYQIPFKKQNEIINSDYSSACKNLETVLDASVKRRMISDVPLGAFLSGGIDSSIVVALASKYTDKLKTYSVGFKDEPFFDETKYAKLVADKFKTDHTVFSLSTQDLFDDLFSVLDYIDEPFADSSALPVHILSRHTRKFVTVALSGDGADELFGGYMKHVGEYKIRNAGYTESLISKLGFLLKKLPQSRNSKVTTLFMRMNKLSEGLALNVKDRYRLFSSIGTQQYVNALLSNKWKITTSETQITEEKWLINLHSDSDMNEVLLTDMNLVLPSDMLYKVDRMSMANSLEVRAPFLDYEVVDFAFSLSADFKIIGNKRKKIVQDTFRKILPEELYNRPKQGFEVPLLKWFRTELKSYIDELTNEEFINEQAIFNVDEIIKLKRQLNSINPRDSTAKMWAIIVFQHWYKKNLAS